MSQITSGIYSILSKPFLYDLFQELIGAHKYRKNFVDKFINFRKISLMNNIGINQNWVSKQKKTGSLSLIVPNNFRIRLILTVSRCCFEMKTFSFAFQPNDMKHELFLERVAPPLTAQSTLEGNDEKWSSYDPGPMPLQSYMRSRVHSLKVNGFCSIWLSVCKLLFTVWWCSFILMKRCLNARSCCSQSAF